MAVDPAALRIVLYPDPILRRRAEPVEFGREVIAVAERMIGLMRSAEGIGLAAPQVGLPWRLFVCDVPADPDEPDAPGRPRSSSDGPMVCVNPELVEPSGGVVPREEGCLSLPGILGDVHRPPTVTLRAVGLDGEPYEVAGAGLLARCWQHELDHLDGVLILDRMSQESKIRVRQAVKRLERVGSR